MSYHLPYDFSVLILRSVLVTYACLRSYRLMCAIDGSLSFLAIVLRMLCSGAVCFWCSFE